MLFHPPEVILPTPRTKEKMQKMNCGSMGSSPVRQLVAGWRAKCHARAMMLIMRDHRAVMLGARRPKTITKTMMTAFVVPNPQRKKQDRAEPIQQVRSTCRRG